MPDYIAKSVRQQIYEASKNRCEYCQTDQQITGGQMHIEHIIPTSRGGSSIFTNLCLSCAWCNTFKSDKITGVDSMTGAEVPLFHPRKQVWGEHFEWSLDGIMVAGCTQTGRVTVEVLKMNNEYVLPARRRWVSVG